jgi:hypothetical protein
MFVKVFGGMSEEEKQQWISILNKLVESAAKGAVEGAVKK